MHKKDSNRHINFTILHLDPMGQGVHKENDEVFFIPKTLPGESGTAKVIKKSKGVNFCTVISIEKKSSARINPECSHYHECNGCNYLHTSYDEELAFKKESLKKHFQKIDHSQISIHKADERFNYRNRVQLHYQGKNTIGFINKNTKKIHSVSQCLLPIPEIKKNIEEIYARPINQKQYKGHVELYLKDNKVKTTWNQRYSFEGFTQVNESMNQKLQELLTSFKLDLSQSVLDLFSGDGNLSSFIPNEIEKFLIDYYPHPKKLKNFFSIDLYDDNALNQFQKNQLPKFSTLILDPPRKGFPNLNLWLEKFKPNTVIYVSCNPTTCARDIALIKSEYKVSQLHLVDLFPSTFHYETVVFLTK